MILNKNSKNIKISWDNWIKSVIIKIIIVIMKKILKLQKFNKIMKLMLKNKIFIKICKQIIKKKCKINKMKLFDKKIVIKMKNNINFHYLI